MASKRDLILVVNPGSTSTKAAVYRGQECLASENVAHPKEELQRLGGIAAQHAMRLEAVLDFFARNGVALDRVLAVAGRGGLTKPILGGVYRVGPKLIRELRANRWGEHASNLGAPLAAEIARRCGAPAFVVDPPTVDELDPLARYSGHPAIQRRSLFHALSQRAAARSAARDLKASYEKNNFIVVHLGGGISVGAHAKGRVVDVNNALDGDGPFSPERSGSLPTGDLTRICFSGEYAPAAVKKMLVGEGGMFAYLGTNDGREVARRIAAGDAAARAVYEAMAYQIAKEVGAAAAALSGRVKAVVLTGGMSASRRMVAMIRKRVGFIAPVRVYPQVEEMNALASAVEAAVAGKFPVQEYR